MFEQHRSLTGYDRYYLGGPVQAAETTLFALMGVKLDYSHTDPMFGLPKETARECLLTTDNHEYLLVLRRMLDRKGTAGYVQAAWDMLLAIDEATLTDPTLHFVA